MVSGSSIGVTDGSAAAINVSGAASLSAFDATGIAASAAPPSIQTISVESGFFAVALQRSNPASTTT